MIEHPQLLAPELKLGGEGGRGIDIKGLTCGSLKTLCERIDAAQVGEHLGK